MRYVSLRLSFHNSHNLSRYFGVCCGTCESKYTDFYVLLLYFLQTAYDESELNVLQATVDSDADSDDEIGSFHDDDGPDSSDQEIMDEDADSLENGGKAKNHDLEWDSSTVSY